MYIIAVIKSATEVEFLKAEDEKEYNTAMEFLGWTKYYVKSVKIEIVPTSSHEPIQSIWDFKHRLGYNDGSGYLSV